MSVKNGNLGHHQFIFDFGREDPAELSATRTPVRPEHNDQRHIARLCFTELFVKKDLLVSTYLINSPVVDAAGSLSSQWFGRRHGFGPCR